MGVIIAWLAQVGVPSSIPCFYLYLRSQGPISPLAGFTAYSGFTPDCVLTVCSAERYVGPIPTQSVHSATPLQPHGYVMCDELNT